MENDFSVDTSKQIKKDFMKKIKVSLNISQESLYSSYLVYLTSIKFKFPVSKNL